MKTEFNIALKTLLFNRKQYTSLFAVCMASVAIMLSSLCVSDGMRSALSQKARLYYGGDLQLMAGGKGHPIKDILQVESALTQCLPPSARVYERFDYDATNTALFFQGEQVRQRMFKGVDFAQERHLFATCTFTEGSADPSPHHDTIVVSAAVARKLGVRAGDAVTLQILTQDGYTNTMPLVVQGISQDSSLFGMYTSYIDIKALRDAAAFPADYVNRLCVYYGRRHGVGMAEVKSLQSKLEPLLNMYPLTQDKDEFIDAVNDAEDAVEDTVEDAILKAHPDEAALQKKYSKVKDKTAIDKNVIKQLKAFDKMIDVAKDAAVDAIPPMYALVTLDANIIDLKMLTDAMRLVVLIIIVFLAAIISVGIASTYRVIVLRRTVEIGTYRALGMARGRVRILFVVEAVELLVSSFIAGLALASVIVMVLCQADLSFIPAFDMFLIRSHLVPVMSAVKTAILLLFISVTTVLSVLFTVRNIIHISPVGALSTAAQ